MKSLFVFLFLGALICSVEGFGRAKEGKCPTPKAKCKPFLKKRICFQDIECSGKRKCCPDGCGNDVCMTAVMPPRPIVGSCPEDARVAITIKNNRRCRRKKTKFCFKGDCNRCCYYKSRCNPHPKLLNNLGACEKELCAKKKCPFQGEVCYFNKKKQAVSCKCNRSCRTPTKNDTVCGTDRITYPSPCEMNLTACQLGDFIGIDYRGECRDNKVTISQAHVDSVSLISGTNGSVVCHFKGHPVQIQWSKQGLDRLPENRMLPYDNMLYIRLVRKEDAGKYFCRAFDGVSTITATVNVTIKEPELVTSKAIQPRRVCMLGKSQGPGQNYIVRFYFNFKTRLCTAFAYGGTGGNENNFKTLERCKRACSHSATPTEICRLAKRPGRCKQRLPKWYYDQRKGKCKMFHYGGCDGNANRFDTENECLQTCSNLACKLPKAVGKCKAHIARWFFNIKTGKCEKFMYTGCDGNSNQYPSKKHCEMKCNPSSSRRRKYVQIRR
ncbi:Carboxypeptidase inhibitor SmCI [Exaiptasia diaphana]|nr:Carboxypeptidase inhibitor SmCI [Exaiptasia diaphana]